MSGRMSTEQIVRRMCVILERCDRAIDDELLANIKDLPRSLRKRLTSAVERLRARIDGIERANEPSGNH